MKRLVSIGILMIVCGTMALVLGQKEFRRAGPLTIRPVRPIEAQPAEEEEGRLPVPKPAVMNVDVQIALTKTEQKTFAEAKAAAVRRVVDGDPLWMHVKFKTRLGDYVVTTRDADDAEKLRYTLYVEMSPLGDITALAQYAIQFSKEDLGLTELKINLAPGLPGRNKSIPVFLMTSGTAKAGVWNNEVRLANTLAMPRALTENLAAAPVVLDLSGGAVKYKKMIADYDSIALRGTPDVSRIPLPGTFYSGPLADLITAKLASENIRHQKLYFSGDGWEEFASFGPPSTKTKRIFSTFTYRRDEGCFYGVAEVYSAYDFTTGVYSPPEIKLQKDFRIPCSEL